MGKRLVLAGGGHAHMMLLSNISSFVDSGVSVTVIQPSEHHYYSGMGPGMLSGYYTPEDIRFQTRFVVERQGGIFIQDKAVRIDPEDNRLILESQMVVDYDVLSCNTGSFVPFKGIEEESCVYSAKPIEKLLSARKQIRTICKSGKVKIAVIGGGPAAIEIAGNAHQLAVHSGCRDISVTLFAGKEVMKNFPQKIGNLLRRNFERRKITIDESGYVEKIDDKTIYLANQKEYEADIIFTATGVRPSQLFNDSDIPTGPQGGLCVNTQLQSVKYPNIFGGGDCIYYSDAPLNKVGVYAVRQNPILLQNIISAFEHKPLTDFNPGGGYLLIFNLGDGTGILQKGSFIWEGKLAFYIKDLIDRRFMRRFQALEN